MPKIRVLVVDDAVVVRRLITETLSRDPALEVVGIAANGRIALQKIPQVNPDIITLDVEMPELDGLGTLRELRLRHPQLPVIMFSTLTRRGAEATLDALALGARDYVAKPANIGSVSEAMERLEQDLIPKIKTHCRTILKREPSPESRITLSSPSPARLAVPSAQGPIEIVCIATSTGGPNALAEVFGGLPAEFPVPVVIVQHMPPLFTAMLAERLTAHSRMPCCEGMDGQRVEAGHAYMAPGGRHMEIHRAGLHSIIRLHDGPPENSCRPAADVLFRSVANVYGGSVMGVVMTGMGQDGMRGCEIIHENGGYIVVQDADSSVVWGMPGSVAQAGYAHKIIPLRQIAGEISTKVRQSRALRSHQGAIN